MKVTHVLLGVAVCGLVVIAISEATSAYYAKHSLAVAQQRIASDQQMIDAAKKDAAAAKAELKALEAKAAAEKEQLASDAFTANLNAEKLRIQLANIQRATPSELGTTAATLLGVVSGIRYNGTDFIVDVTTFRLITTKLADQHDFTLTREPLYKKTIADAQALISTRESELIAKDKVLNDQAIQITGLEDTKAQLSKEIKTYKGLTFIGKAEWTIIGGALGYLGGRFTK